MPRESDPQSTTSNWSAFSYGPTGARYKQRSRLGSVVETSRYLGSLEVIEKPGRTEYRHSVTAGGRTIALYTTYSDSTPSQWKYLFQDHLGSTDTLDDPAHAPDGCARHHHHPDLRPSGALELPQRAGR